MKVQMKVQKATVWSLIHRREHRYMDEEARQVLGAVPILTALFPGAVIFSMTGFYSLMYDYGVVVLKKQFPELEEMSEDQVSAGEEVEIGDFLPSEGEEWQTEKWQSRFANKIAA